MSVKKSVRLSDQAVEICRKMSLSGGEESINYSGSINSVFAQFAEIIGEHTPELNENEWNAFYCCYNGYMPHPDIKEEARLLAWHISEGYQYDAQVTEFLGDPESAMALIERVKSWSMSERLAVIYKAKSFWARD